MGRPTVTWLTPFVPDRHGGGGQIRQAYLLPALAEVAEVSLYSNQPLRDPLVRETVSSFSLVDSPTTDWSKRSKLVRRARDLTVILYGHEPREVSNFRGLRGSLVQAVGTEADATIVEYAGLAPLIQHRRGERPWILTLHNVGSVMERQEQAFYIGGRRAWLHGRDAGIWERWESKVPSRYDVLVAVSAEDAVHFRDRSGRAPEVIPNGVDTERFQPSEWPNAPRLIFTGALNTGPNYYGLLWFCRDVLPLIQRGCPDVTLDIVGSNAPPQILDLRRLPGVSVHVDVPDILPYLRAARVSVVPLKIGTGTRLKALEAMAAGRPVVGTSVGLGGLDVADRVHAEIADDPESFTDRVCRLLNDDEHITVLTRRARRLVEERYSWRAIGTQYVRLITDALV
jgi:glycosyltransferase involved in cell wall biosynthesis